MMFINRDYNRSEHDDWLLNVQPRLCNHTVSVPVCIDTTLIGWKIQLKFE